MARCVRIERVNERPGSRGPEEAVRYEAGYLLRPPGLPQEGKNRAENCVYAPTLDKAAELIGEGYSIRVGNADVNASFVGPKNVRLVMG